MLYVRKLMESSREAARSEAMTRLGCGSLSENREISPDYVSTADLTLRFSAAALAESPKSIRARPGQ